MKVGVLQFFSWPERRVELANVFARALERIEIMDSTGYDAVWLAEHHFSSFSVCPSVHMVGTLAAARTKRLRMAPGCRWRRSITRCGSPKKWHCSTCCPAGG